MAKIFSADYRNGTFIDSVNKIVGVPTSLSKLIRTEKGTALARVVNHDGVTYTTGSKSLSKFTVVAWIKQRTTDDSHTYGVAYIGYTQMIRRLRSSTDYSNYFNSGVRGSISIPITTCLNKWMQFVVTYDGVNVVSSVNNKQIVSSPSETTATLDFTSIIVGRSYDASRYSDSDILKFDVYDDVISDKEIELDYKALLDTQITEKEVRGFEYPKPTDLSYLKDTGLAAAYNFIPNGNTLVDISGNGNNGTINGALRTKDGMSFNGLNNYIQLKTSVLSNITLSLRFKTSSSSRQSIIAGALDGTCVFINNGVIGSGNTLLAGMATTKNTYKDGLWHSLTVIKTGAKTYRFFIDGAEDSGGSDAGYRAATEFQIGGVNNSPVGVTPTLHFNGEIQDIRVYNRELTQAEITAYHNSFVKPVLIESFSDYAVGDTL